MMKGPRPSDAAFIVHNGKRNGPSCLKKGGRQMAKRGSWTHRFKDLAAEYAYLVTLVCVIGVIVGSAVYTQRVREASQEALVQAAAGAPEIAMTASPTPQPRTTPLPTIAPLQVRVSLLEGRMVWPMEGEVLRGHETTELVFWEALGAWQVHAGIDIAGEAGGSVLCAAEGTVSRVTRDALWGASVEVLHEGDRRTVYRGLALCYVEEGEGVARGQEIGTLDESIPCESELGAHLHMEAFRDEAPQDPLATLPER